MKEKLCSIPSKFIECSTLHEVVFVRIDPSHLGACLTQKYGLYENEKKPESLSYPGCIWPPDMTNQGTVYKGDINDELSKNNFTLELFDAKSQ